MKLSKLLILTTLFSGFMLNDFDAHSKKQRVQHYKDKKTKIFKHAHEIRNLLKKSKNKLKALTFITKNSLSKMPINELLKSISCIESILLYKTREKLSLGDAILPNDAVTRKTRYILDNTIYPILEKNKHQIVFSNERVFCGFLWAYNNNKKALDLITEHSFSTMPPNDLIGAAYHTDGWILTNDPSIKTKEKSILDIIYKVFEKNHNLIFDNAIDSTLFIDVYIHYKETVLDIIRQRVLLSNMIPNGLIFFAKYIRSKIILKDNFNDTIKLKAQNILNDIFDNIKVRIKDFEFGYFDLYDFINVYREQALDLIIKSNDIIKMYEGASYIIKDNLLEEIFSKNTDPAVKKKIKLVREIIISKTTTN